MPDTPSSDDQFADLFGRLPSPPNRAASATSSDSSASTPAPTSRRAAREAATASGETRVTPAVETSPVSAPRTAATHEPAPVHAPAAAAASDTLPPGPRRTPGSIDALFGAEAVHEADDPKKRHDRDRRKSRIAGWVIVGVVLAIIGGLAVGGTYVWTTYEDKIRAFLGWEEPKDFEAGMANGEVVVTIVEGDTGSSISTTLYDAGVTKTSGAFYDYLISTASAATFHPGAYRLQYEMTSEAALAALEDPANKLENTAQLREGLTVEQSLPILADGTGIALKDFQSAVADPSEYGVAADSLEGWLFPATYTFDPGATATDVVQTLVDRTITSLDAAGVPKDRREEILTIASIIEREARYEDDFYKVSRVIQNRLDPSNDETFGKLQMDSTAQYGYGEMHDGTVSSTAEALEDDNPWNTYVHEGLPIGPIANPGDTAIKAAMEPADGPWLYFVTVNLETGETVFTETYSEHLKAVDQWRQWCADNPDGGC
ncbi:MAG: endolytic transglycosylase MltG [Candidatus Microbacterium phytovorans]|uniref:Endolytic murein transglycosylase n=1 Tax=Candidatus Microbacterium phytovorans TaxID=3121374 RepID=A0AAJ6B4G7_9MICO|nr:endolytic transglycosylase MltG [Microbacterium sp.]WEK14332.1 MAG: endolytic transglycosylase MltG [Microbacterium sp.]